ncbi:MAG: GNAT family N-acetyltransferase, partial [Prevotellaceae bacterium]|nr:GNAT family N-acetyltransferase [Prevotellaceae bacterium]
MFTERLILRRWLEDDADALFKYASDPEVGPRAGWSPHRDVEESREIIRTLFGGETMWAIVLKGSDEPIGCIGYLPKGVSNIGVGDNEVEIGYWIARPFWNQGICTEALTWMIDYCFREKGYSALWSDFFVDNPASDRVMEKCGFMDTGIETFCPN